MSTNSKQIVSADLFSATPWEKGEIELVCSRIDSQTHDVNTYWFRGIEATRFHFKPGQFVTLKLEIDGKPVYRSYTISSSPSRPYALGITIKQIPGGVVSNWLAENLKKGDKITAMGPEGQFNCIDTSAEKCLLLSAGSGITPMLSISQWLLDTAPENADIQFIHSARSEMDIICHWLLDDMAAKHANFQTEFVLEQEALCSAWSGLLDQDKLQAICPDWKTRNWFVCGPEGYMKAVKKMASDLGLPEGQYFEESFGGPQLEAAPVAVEEDTAKETTSFSLNVTNHGKLVQISEDQTILEALEKEGLPIIGACRQGICGSCKVTSSTAEVTSTSDVSLTPAEKEQGAFLACCSTLKSDGEMVL
ncbi:hybrid-cluster NAD(P)-dependent oxidoreductase [Pelagibaculum spongiae]|uniref:Hybrid-cluster NAD(P)-dependent oxidoreductase n=1 Tax=Pelagibaculum spongiae TaxID=2080658 RepID=A0A2V1GQX6_9GAMM|nr:hybrid-cluster NAD(P)-dependent oxidoreductase [Pelagibaculum spongiae]PVZ65704.1 hybrid-cluster NAD(P)-dependent oxidoreductase [Pelagibaculum spongiae]